MQMLLNLKPLIEVDKPDIKDKKRGFQAFENSQVAFLVLAGGQGSRLQSDLPKGCFPVSLIQKKSLFQIFFEKIYYAQKKYGAIFPVTILTSEFTHQKTVSFLKENDFFGVNEKQVDFVRQGSLSFLNAEKKPFFYNGKLAKGPDGNGRALEYLKKNGILEKYRHKKALGIISIDNPLLDPFDEKMLGFHLREKKDLTLKVIRRQKNMGAVGCREGKIAVIEYLHLPKEKEKDFPYGNINYFFISLVFAEKAAKKKLPVYLVKKELFPNVWGYKSESFLFDLFIFAERFGVIKDRWQNCFFPLKSEKDLLCIQEAMRKKDQKIFQKIFSSDYQPKELSFYFHYLKKTEKEKIKRKKIISKDAYLSENMLI